MGSCLGKEEQGIDGGCSPTVNSLVAAQTDSFGIIVPGECRMCFEEESLANDPVIPLGCNCFGENSCAHESCIRKWFPKVVVTTGHIACEICNARLGGKARAIVKSEIRSTMLKHLLRRGMVQVGHAVARSGRSASHQCCGRVRVLGVLLTS